MVDRGRDRGAAAGAKPKAWTVVDIVVIVIVDMASARASSPPSACCSRGGVMLVIELLLRLLGARAWCVCRVKTPAG